MTKITWSKFFPTSNSYSTYREHEQIDRPSRARYLYDPLDVIRSQHRVHADKIYTITCWIDRYRPIVSTESSNHRRGGFVTGITCSQDREPSEVSRDDYDKYHSRFRSSVRQVGKVKLTSTGLENRIDHLLPRKLPAQKSLCSS